VADDIVTQLRAISQFVGAAGPKLREAADLLDAIDALHQPSDPILDASTGLGDFWCEACGPGDWPCPTHLLLHPGEADRG